MHRRRGAGKILAIAAILLLVVISVAALQMRSVEEPQQQVQEAGQEQAQEAQQAQETGQPTGQAGIEGTWQGTYTSNYGKGTWKWVIAGSGGSYKGCIMVGGPYRSNDWIPITIQLEGTRITVGTVGGFQVTFTGTIDGARASGEWRTANGMDSGEWSGEKVSDDKDLPCMASTTGPAGGEEVQEEHQVQEGLCTPSPPSSLKQAYQIAWKALVDTFGEDSMRCYHQETPMGMAYVASFELVGYQPSMAQEYLASLEASLGAQGAQVVTSTAEENLIVVSAVVQPSQGPYPMLMATIQIDRNDEGVTAAIMVQAPGP